MPSMCRTAHCSTAISSSHARASIWLGLVFVVVVVNECAHITQDYCHKLFISLLKLDRFLGHIFTSISYGTAPVYGIFYVKNLGHCHAMWCDTLNYGMPSRALIAFSHAHRVSSRVKELNFCQLTEYLEDTRGGGLLSFDVIFLLLESRPSPPESAVSMHVTTHTVTFSRSNSNSSAQQQRPLPFSMQTASRSANPLGNYPTGHQMPSPPVPAPVLGPGPLHGVSAGGNGPPIPPHHHQPPTMAPPAHPPLPLPPPPMYGQSGHVTPPPPGSRQNYGGGAGAMRHRQMMHDSRHGQSMHQARKLHLTSCVILK